VSDLAYYCAMLELPVDPVDLYYTEDSLMLGWLSDLCDRVSAERRRQAKK
jgi:hypothetical protein